MARAVLITTPINDADVLSPISVQGFVSPHNQDVTVSLFRPGVPTPIATASATPDGTGFWSTSLNAAGDGEYWLVARQTGLQITHSISITVRPS